MDTFMLCPMQQGYGFGVGNNIREQALEGGMPRQVVKFVGAVHTTNVTVHLKDNQTRQYFWAFWRKNQTTTWKWTLDLDGGVLEECECKFSASAAPSYSLIDGVARQISFTVLVKPIPRNADFDEVIVDLWQMGGSQYISNIEKIPNVWLPDALGVD